MPVTTLMNDTKAHQIHQRFIQIASDVSDGLTDAIRRVGPQEFQPDDSMSLVHRLCRSVAGQQLSVTAARTIWGRLMDAAEESELIHFFTEENAEVMRNCGLSAAKVRAMCGIANEGRSGNLEAHQLRVMNHQQRSVELTRLWGGRAVDGRHDLYLLLW
jgi:DNA-3-methyladenine glycosylase II